MSLKDIRYDGSEKLNVKNLATGIKASKKEKEPLILKTAENMARAAELQEKLDKRAETIRLYVALFCSMVACLVMLGGLFLLE